jgi:chaperonin GroEL (HSP60 family)
LKLVREGVSPIDMKNGIMLAKAKIIEYLEAIRRQALSKEDLYNAAMVSTNYDEWLSKILSEACFESGLNGVIHIEPNRSYETTLLVFCHIWLISSLLKA